MSIKELTVNTVLKSAESGHLHRVLWVSADKTEIYTFDMETLAIPSLAEYSSVQKQVAEGVFTIEDSDPYIAVTAEDALTDKEKKSRDEIWEIMGAAVMDEPRIFTKRGRGEIVAEVANASGKTRKVVYQYLKTYWKRGKTRDAFVPLFRSRGAPGRERSPGDSKRGRPRKYDDGVGVNVDDGIKEIFKKSADKYYNTRKENTLQHAYDMMIKDHYTLFKQQSDGKTKAELVSEEKIPTIAQFRYWYSKMYGEKEKLIKRKGETKFNLDHRAVTGKSDYGVMGPGAKYEIDATIGDIYLVSRFNRADIIGRPVLYFVVDMFSRMVTGMYVGLEGPSWVGMMMSIANAACDKVAYCAEYGIEITEEEWPCRGVPGAIRGDRGELMSKFADTLVNALNVRIESAPPFRADMKGIVEQQFNKINRVAVSFLPGHVKKDEKERGGQDYRLEAILDIQQFTKIMIECVLYHNNRHLLEDFERTEEMITDNIAPIPLDMWNWGITHRFGALRSFPEETVKLALMPVDTATVTVKGIRFKGLYYLCERAATEDWFETARAKGSWKINISYDPRNMNTIYIRETDGTVNICWLAEWQEKYQGKCLYEIDFLHEAEKLMQHKNAPNKTISKIELSVVIDEVISEAQEMARQTVVPKSKSERTNNIRENRRNEKEINRQSEVFSLAAEEPVETAKLPESLPEDGEPISPTLALIKKMQEERFNG